MIPDTIADTERLLAAKIRVPQHVVYRSFPSETVVLNLQTGKYHGLNATAGTMLDELQRSVSAGEAIAPLAARFEQPDTVIACDICSLCAALLARGLIEADAP